MSTTTNLFQSKSMGQHIQDALDRIKLDVGRCDTIVKLDAYAAGLSDDVKIRPLKLDRVEAEFDPKPTASGQEVSVSIPFSGNHQLFQVGDRRMFGKGHNRDRSPVLSRLWVGAIRRTLLCSSSATVLVP